MRFALLFSILFFIGFRFLAGQVVVTHKVMPVKKVTRMPDSGPASLSTWDTLHFSHPGGIYKRTFALTINNLDTCNEIRFTLDGTPPGQYSPAYSNPIELTKSVSSDSKIGQIPNCPPNLFRTPPAELPRLIVIRAASFDLTGNQVSDIRTHTYLIEENGIHHHALPIVSISSDVNVLFDITDGIFVPGIHWDPNNPDWTGNYYQRGDEWERQVNVEFFDPHNRYTLNQSAGLRTHGGNSRRFAQKGIKLYARETYGKSKFNFEFFQTTSVKSFKRLILRPFSCSWSQSGLEDHVSVKMAQSFNIDGIASRPVVLYINGTYWGIYFLQECPDQHYLSSRYDIDSDEVDIIGNWDGMTEAGIPDNFLSLYQFIDQNDLSLDGNYQTVTEWIDIDNFIDYQIFEIYSANSDWPANNMKCWRHRQGGKWRWIFNDGDASLQYPEFKGISNALSMGEEEWPTNSRATLFLRRLLENETFRSIFLIKFEKLLTHGQIEQNAHSVIEESLELIYSEMNLQISRFGIPADSETWSDEVEDIRIFLSERKNELIKQINKELNAAIAFTFQEGPDDFIDSLISYPNPTDGQFYVSFNSGRVEIGEVKITTTSGREIFSAKTLIHKGLNTLNYQFLNLSGGILIYSIFTPTQIVSTLVIVNQN